MGLSSLALAQGAMRTDRLRQLSLEAQGKPGLGQAPATIILETGRLDARLRALIQAAGGRVRFSSGSRHEIRLPAGSIGALLDSLPAGIRARLPFPFEPVAVTSEGVALTGAADMHALGNGGAGVSIGIIDAGFTGYADSQAAGELPADLVITDYTGNGTGGGTHGTNVAEIVHDMAPNAKLYLARVATSLQMEQAVNDMITAGVDIISHSLVWFNAAFYDGTGPICDIADTAEANGIQWVSAAGNHRYRHFLGTFTDADGDLRHEFATGQNYNTIDVLANKRISVFLNWDDYPGSSIDYNLYLYDGDPDAGGALVASSETIQSGTAWPYESLSYTPPADGTYYIVVKRKNSATPTIPLTLFASRSLGTYTTASSLLQPADCNYVLAVGASNLADAVAGYSSEGPTTDGRARPVLTGPSGVTTSLTTSFGGTSAATPHVAGAAALVLAQAPSLTTSQLRDRMIADAHDISAAGYDYRSGWGRVSLDADGDGLNHDDDNCPLVANADQADNDGDGAGDACDTDDDNDGLADTLEASIGTDPFLVDTDGDGLSDYDEVAWDGDATAYVAGQDLDPLSPDTDNDGYLDATDPIPLTYNYGDGDLAPLGAPDGVVDVADYLLAERIVLGAVPQTTLELAHGDLYPPGAPDGVIDISDLILLLRKMP